MSQKQPKPTLTGQRIKTRKRDEKEKYDPTGFRDAVVQGLNEAGTDLDQVSKFLDKAGSQLDYRRYSETLLDILFAGGILAPGGTVVEDADKTKVSRSEVCVFAAEEEIESIKAYATVFTKVTRRYKYLEKKLEDEINKILMFLKGFTPEERNKLAMICGLFLAQSNIKADCLKCLLSDHLVKDGIAMDFMISLWKVWLSLKDINSVSSTLRKAQLDKRLLEFLPSTKRTEANFEKMLDEAGLTQLVEFQRAIAHADTKKELHTDLTDLIKEQAAIKEIENSCKEYMKKTNLGENEVVVLVWKCLMASVEWNKKEELVADQAINHLKTYAPLLASFTTQGKSELALLLKIQDYCYENINFMKAFCKIVILLYKGDVLSEDVILKWHKESHLAKGKSVFLEQTKKFVEWLQQAEEESESEEEGED
ncbi:eIF5-mimic protein 2-A-like [Amphiura filiformis]|uniref:eIF5-mimic protein 2-A-like n=1 Tax=Amphiura filiformis TaxID=82378 RepID=UPI003B2168EF